MIQKPRIFPIILAGGAGKRLWPLSTHHQPKQFLPLTGDHSLFQQAVGRARRCADQLIVVASQAHRFAVAEQLRAAGVESAVIILEPEARNTAPSISCAALYSYGQDPESVLLVMPSDHYIGDEYQWLDAMNQGVRIADEGYHVTFGIVPTHPSSSYGYIQKGESVNGYSAAFQVAHFKEKPDEQVATSYLLSGDYLWNSGMFMFKSRLFLEEMATIQPEMMRFCREAYQNSRKDMEFLRLDENYYLKCPSSPIDKALMEHTRRAAVLQTAMGWSDVGSFHGLEQVLRQESSRVMDNQGFSESAQNVIYSPHKKTYVVGLENIRIINTDEATVIMNREVSSVPEDVIEQFQRESLHHQAIREYRPWGEFQLLFADRNVKVKRLSINSGARISLQMHHERSEHWTVIEGMARITIDDVVSDVGVGQSVYVPIGSKHRIENSGDDLLIIIEVQTGERLSESDITRYDDDYGRQ